MKLDQIITALEAEPYCKKSSHETEDLVSFVAGDLMSDILTSDDEHMVLITSLSTDQVIRTADFVGAKAIILVNGKKPSDSLLTLAKSTSISVLGTNERMFDVCIRLGKVLGK